MASHQRRQRRSLFTGLVIGYANVTGDTSMSNRLIVTTWQGVQFDERVRRIMLGNSASGAGTTVNSNQLVIGTPEWSARRSLCWCDHQLDRFGQRNRQFQ